MSGYGTSNLIGRASSREQYAGPLSILGGKSSSLKAAGRSPRSCAGSRTIRDPMNTSNRIQISAPFERLFSLAADIARWPEILPHYRWVKILERRDGLITAEMAARHKGV